MNFKKIMAGVVASVAAVSTMAVAASAANYAGLYFQTNVYGFRNNIAQGQAVYWDEFNDAAPYATWEYTDVEITGDGQYTVSFKKSIEQDTNGGPETFWNLLGLSTNIPSADYPDLKITIDSLKVDGVEIAEAKNGVASGESKLSVDDYSDGNHGITSTIVDVYTVGLQNAWNPDEQIVDATKSFGSEVVLTFTISGMGGDAASDDGAGEADGTASEDDGNAGDGTAADNNTVGNTTTTTSDKTNADTGVEGVAVVAGIAVLATGAIVIAKKRK